MLDKSLIIIFCLILPLALSTSGFSEESIKKGGGEVLSNAINIKNQALRSSGSDQTEMLRKAINIFRGVCEKHREDRLSCAKAMLHIASIFEILDQKDEAMQLNAAIVENYSEYRELSALAKHSIGVILTSQKKYEQAIETFRSVAEEYPEHKQIAIESQEMIGNNYLLAGDITGAQKEYFKLLCKYQDQQHRILPESFNLLAMAYLAKGNRISPIVLSADYIEMGTRWKINPSVIKATEAYRVLTDASKTARYPPSCIYEVGPYENLWTISKKVYGTPVLWPLIYEENRHQIKTGYELSEGQKLRIRNDYEYRRVAKTYAAAKAIGPQAVVQRYPELLAAPPEWETYPKPPESTEEIDERPSLGIEKIRQLEPGIVLPSPKRILPKDQEKVKDRFETGAKPEYEKGLKPRPGVRPTTESNEGAVRDF